VRYPIGASSGGGPEGNTYSGKSFEYWTSEKDAGNNFYGRGGAMLDINVRIANLPEAGKLYL